MTITWGLCPILRQQKVGRTELTYNEFGAPIQTNPAWCNLISLLLSRFGNLFYPKHKEVSLWFWSQAYAWGDVQCLSGLKGYKR